MKDGKLQCKDIPTRPILEYIATHGVYGRNSRWDIEANAMPPMPETGRLGLAKLGQLYRSGLIDGCPCGCRGDFSITDKGRAALLGALL